MNKKIKTLIFLITIFLLPLLLTISVSNKYKVIKYDDYTVYKNINYSGHERNLYDIYIPKVLKHQGVVLEIHGGAWVAGSKENSIDGCTSLCLSQNVITIGLSYHYISETYHCEDILMDIKNCLDNAYIFLSELGYNVDSALLTGGSAGGHLSYLYGYKYPNAAKIKVKAVVGYSGPTDITNLDYDSTVGILTGYILFTDLSGSLVIMDNSRLHNQALIDVSPYYYVNENSVPTVICHGALDSVVPVSDAYKLDETLTKYHVEHQLIIFPHSDHGLESELDETERKLSYQYLYSYIDQYL